MLAILSSVNWPKGGAPSVGLVTLLIVWWNPRIRESLSHTGCRVMFVARLRLRLCLFLKPSNHPFKN